MWAYCFTVEKKMVDQHLVHAHCKKTYEPARQNQQEERKKHHHKQEKHLTIPYEF